MEILTVKEVAKMLRISERSVYELCKARAPSGDVREHPLPCFRMGASVRFIRKDVEEWIDKLVENRPRTG
jgi:predicted DNA-binding transcriptional regulator AlpA